MSGKQGIYPKRLVVGGGPLPPAVEATLSLDSGAAIAPTAKFYPVGSVGVDDPLNRTAYIQGMESGDNFLIDSGQIMSANSGAAITGYEGNNTVLLLSYNTLGVFPIADPEVINAAVIQQFVIANATTLAGIIQVDMRVDQLTGNQELLVNGGSIYTVPIAPAEIAIGFTATTCTVYDNLTGAPLTSFPAALPLVGGVGFLSSAAATLSFGSGPYSYNYGTDSMGVSLDIYYKAAALSSRLFVGFPANYNSFQGFPVT